MKTYSNGIWEAANDSFISSNDLLQNGGNYICAFFGPDKDENRRRVIAMNLYFEGIETEEIEEAIKESKQQTIFQSCVCEKFEFKV